MHLISQINKNHDDQTTQEIIETSSETGLKVVTEMYLNGSYGDSLGDVIEKLNAATGFQTCALSIVFNPDMINSVIRNYRMASKIKRLVQKNPEDKFFFAVGVYHLTIHHPTIQEILEKDGYVITRIPPGEKV